MLTGDSAVGDEYLRVIALGAIWSATNGPAREHPPGKSANRVGRAIEGRSSGRRCGWLPPSLLPGSGPGLQAAIREIAHDRAERPRQNHR